LQQPQRVPPQGVAPWSWAPPRGGYAEHRRLGVPSKAGVITLLKVPPCNPSATPVWSEPIEPTRAHPQGGYSLLCRAYPPLGGAQDLCRRAA
jgi:hypothetical protein